MDYSIIGFPRIGIHRELKFATEAYFRSEIDADELKRVVSQRENGAVDTPEGRRCRLYPVQ